MSNDERRFDPRHQHRLLNPERLAHWDPPRFLARFGLQSGQTVLDLGCGPGFWTLPLANLVGETGHVWAIDVSQELLDALAARNPPAQVRLRRTQLPIIDMPDASADLAWVAFVFHEVDPPEQLASELRRVLRPGARVAVLDWRPDADGDQGPPRAHRLTPEQIMAWLCAAGFATARQTWQDTDSYLVEAVAQVLPQT